MTDEERHRWEIEIEETRANSRELQQEFAWTMRLMKYQPWLLTVAIVGAIIIPLIAPSLAFLTVYFLW